MSSKIGHAVMSVVGLVVGGLISIAGYYGAKSAVEVRPNLADVGFITAFLTNHGGDWMWYHYPAPMAVWTILFVVLIANVVAWIGTK